MGRILSKEEFMESMITSTEEAEESKNIDPKVPEEKPRKKPGPKPGSKRKAQTENTANISPKEDAPVAAGRKKRRSKKDAVMEEAVSEAIAKSNKQTEALRAAIQIMIDYTDGLTLKADKLVNLADIYSGYIETLEEMTE